MKECCGNGPGHQFLGRLLPGRQCRMCRSERRLVLGVVGMVAVMSIADEVRSQTARSDRASVVVADSINSAAPSSPTSAARTNGAPRSSVAVAIRALDLSALPPSAFADWTESTR